MWRGLPIVVTTFLGVGFVGADKPADDTHWSLRPLATPTVPAAPKGTHPVDAFVRAKLASQGLTPSPKADKRTLLRRLTYDLHGLPPTPAEVDAFLKDTAADAYEKLVDRLLASPRYGERWARHWMDIAHYAETHGHDQDAVREHAWPYRDYLIRAFNADVPYARFVQEQVAADVLFPNDPTALAALGFLAAGPWDESSQKDIRDDTVDKKQAQNIDRDDIVTTVFTAFTSTSVHCARCHDHKFDPITIDEYYGLQAVFAGIERANRPYDVDPAIAKKRVELQQRLASIAARKIDVAKSAPNVLAWEEKLKKRQSMWAALPADATAKHSKPEPMKDGSIRFGGTRPEKDTYTLTVTTTQPVSALRLEVLTDETLPQRGPGRQDNGNLHLSEVSVTATSGSSDTARNIPIIAALADFDQSGWDITRAIDGKGETAWGIFPAVGQAHEAVFRLKDTIPGGARLQITLEQNHGGGHLIGRLRLSATTTVEAQLTGLVLPMGVAHIVGIAPEKRTPAQVLELTAHVLKEETEAALAAVPKPQMVYAGTNQFTTLGNFSAPKEPRPVHVLKRGDILRPGPLADPAALSFIKNLPAELKLTDAKNEGQRRAALAHWLTHKDNVLVWRSIVNRTWHHHFGRGIVATPNDFGIMGATPTHPELLDWLAVWFRDRGSLKQLHRLLVTSETYQQVSLHRADMAAKDEPNAYLWRMNRQRLDAEAVRDTILAISGTLDERMGGPSDRHFILSPGIHVTPNVDYNKLDVDSPTARRRSVYRFVFRTLPDPLLEALDCPDASLFTPVRTNSVTAQQALALLNDRFTVRYAEHMATRLENDAATLETRIALAYRLALSRDATAKERDRLAAYAKEYGLAAACRVLLNCNEFMFVD